MARIVEQLTPLLISINVRYKTHAGIRITGLRPTTLGVMGADRRGVRPASSLMRVALLAGGTGGAKLAAGMQELVGAELAVIANTADDTADPRPPRLPRSRPDHLLARRRDRRGARLGDPRRLASPSTSASSGSARRAGSSSRTATSPPASTGPTSWPRAGR